MDRPRTPLEIELAARALRECTLPRTVRRLVRSWAALHGTVPQVIEPSSLEPIDTEPRNP